MHSTSIFSSKSCLTIFFMLVTVFGAPNMEMRCKDTERAALLGFKKGLTDPSGRLSSWVGVHCCQWSGVECNNISGNVIKLDLRNPFPSRCITKGLCLGGEINSSLLTLRYLNYLDLSSNNFEGIQIPEFLGMFKNLRYLNLSSSSFSGNIPPHLGKLSTLNYLDLYSDSSLSCANVRWISGLSSLKHLNMGKVELRGKGSKLLQAVNMIPSLEELHLHYCGLDTLPASLPFVNLTLLSVLDLSLNGLQYSIPKWLFNLTSLTRLDLNKNHFSRFIPGEFMNFPYLEYLDFSDNLSNGDIHQLLDSFITVCPNLVTLDLSGNRFEGYLPESLGMLKNLKQLHLGDNFFWGSIPATVGSLSFLEELNLSFNEMNGTIPATLGQLSQLKDLNLEGNLLQGVVTEAHLMNLTSLQSLVVNRDATNTDKLLVINVTSEWHPPFRLNNLDLGNCQVGPTFPVWLRVQSRLNYVNLHNAGIEDSIPEEWFLKLSSQITVLDLSDNRIKGKLPHKLKAPELVIIDLRNNHFEGSLPLWSTNAAQLFLQNNLFSGSIPNDIGELMPNLEILDLSENHLNGTIPSSICALSSLIVLSLRNNQLSGKLPKCRDLTLMQISAIDVANNNISGDIPSSLGLLTTLYVLVLSNNNLDGEIPPSLQNCSDLKILDLGGNRLSGNLPLWIGKEFAPLWILSLRSNAFNGTIPMQWCNLPTLHILDLAHNNLSGFIPNCLGNLSSLQTRTNWRKTNNGGTIALSKYMYLEQVLIVAKGRELEYSSSTLQYVNSIDLSANSLTGEIPEGITNLTALDNLNFSMNNLTGSIPKEIGKLRWLETLDLSQNHLSGPIPQSVSSLNSLSHLNLSYNNLIGRIPSGNQLQTLNDISIYEGNPSLCGMPLPTKCEGDVDNVLPTDEGFEEFDYEALWFYIFGFVVGLSGVCCTLWKKESWRRAFYQSIRLE